MASIFNFSRPSALSPATPEEVRAQFLAFHQHINELSDAELDALLGFSAYSDQVAHESMHDRDLNRRYGQEQFTYEPTPYRFTRYFLELMQPTENDVIYDLGAGYGRVVFYTALVAPPSVKGIEIVPERVKEAQELITHLDLRNVSFDRKNVLDTNFRDGTGFFLFNPFSEHTFWWAIDQLRDVALDHPIYIATWGGGLTDQFRRQTWLKLVGSLPYEPNPLHALRVYRSR